MRPFPLTIPVMTSPHMFCYKQQGKSNILVSTDVAARGLHINRLQYVVNYDFPLNLEQYCHRVGRTGRQGKEGQAYSLLSRNMSMLAADLIKLLEVCAQKLVFQVK
jgi:superfamily II DNA/RNA helicase